MEKERGRIRLVLAPDTDTDALLEAARLTLKRPIGPVLRLGEGRLLSLYATAAEMERLSRLQGVLRAEREGRCELPPRPHGPEKKRE